MHANTPPLHRRALLLSTALGLCPAVLLAQPGARIWRCGNGYSDQPCPAGTEIVPADAPTDRARADADDATRRMRAQADALARDRERQEAAAAGRPPAIIARTSPWESQNDEDDKPTQGKKLKRPKTEKGRHPKNDSFTAKGPGSGKGRSAR